MSDFEDNEDGWSDYEGDIIDADDQNEMYDYEFDDDADDQNEMDDYEGNDDANDQNELDDYEGDDDADDRNEMDYDAIEDLEGNAELNDYEAVDGNADMGQSVNIRKVLSLKENCLDCITKNFERFNSAYLTSKDPVLRRKIEFLQRVYTSCVIHSLHGKKLLNDRHLEFLINEHLKELDLKIFVGSGCSLKAIEKRIILVGHGFLKVSFAIDTSCNVWKNDIPEFINTTICHLPNVEVLHILDHCNNTSLKNVSAYCTKLNELNIDGSSNVTSKGLEMLCNKLGDRRRECSIKVLSLRFITVEDSTIRFLLNNMPFLEVLNYNYLPIILYSMHKDDFKNNTLNNAKKYNLTKLDFLESDNRLTEEDILHVWTEVCPNIKTLNIALSTENCLDLISRFSKLENLAVDGVNLTVDGVNNTVKQCLEFNNFLKSNGIKLHKLKIEGLTFSISILMESCSNLKNLHLTKVQFQSLKNLTKDQFPDTSSLKSLSDLCLGNISFSDQFSENSVTSILLSSPNLEKLSFEQCWFQNSEMNTKLAKFFEHSTVQHLSFCNCNMNLALLESIILTCSSLVSLTIDSCETISYEDICNLNLLNDSTRNFVQIVYNNYESYENSISSNEEDFLDYDYDYYEGDGISGNEVSDDGESSFWVYGPFGYE